MRNRRLLAAIVFALLAAAAGALAVGLEAPELGGVAAVAGVAAAAVASLGLGPEELPAPGAAPVDPEAPEIAAAARVPGRRETRRAAGPPEAGSSRRHPSATPGPEDPTLEGDETPLTRELARRMQRPAAVGEAAELVDPVTDLLDHRYFLVALERGLATARRKLQPLTLVVFELWPDDPAEETVPERSLKVLSAIIRGVLRESDTACRIDERSIAVLLEETPEAGAVWATERVRGGFFATTFRGRVKLAVGMASYPASAMEPDRLLAAARGAAERSRAHGEESIEIAHPEESAEGAGS